MYPTEADLLEDAVPENISDTTTAKTSKIVMLNSTREFKVGDIVTFNIIAHDGKGNRRQRGGDIMRLWMTADDKNLTSLIEEKKPPCNTINTQLLWNQVSPVGFFKNGVWSNVLCEAKPDLRRYKKCFKGKKVLFFGDSLSRQMLEDLARMMDGKYTTKWNYGVWHQPLEYVDTDNNLTATWVAHSLPFSSSIRVADYNKGISNLFDEISSEEDAVIIISHHTHILPYHQSVFKERLDIYRRAISSFLKRNPHAIVFVKGVSAWKSAARPPAIIAGCFSELYNNLIRCAFSGVSERLIYLDHMDMTIMAEMEKLHPPPLFPTSQRIDSTKMECKKVNTAPIASRSLEEDKPQSSIPLSRCEDRRINLIPTCSSWRRTNTRNLPPVLIPSTDHTKQKALLVSEEMDNACMSNVSSKSEFEFMCSESSCCPCSTSDGDVMGRISCASMDSEVAESIVPENLMLSSHGACTCSERLAHVGEDAARGTSTEDCCNSGWSEDTLCDGYNCQGCRRERIKQWQHMGRALRRLLDQSRHSVTQGSACSHRDHMISRDRCHLQTCPATGFQIDCSSACVSSEACSGPSESSLPTVSHTTSADFMPSDSTVRKCGRHFQRDPNYCKIQALIRNRRDCVRLQTARNSDSVCSSEVICPCNCSSSDTVSKTCCTSDSSKHFLCNDAMSDDEKTRDHWNCACAMEPVCCANRICSVNNSMDPVLQHMEDSNSGTSDNGSQMMSVVSTSSKLNFTPGHSDEPQCLCKAKGAVEFPVDSGVHSHFDQLSSDDSLIIPDGTKCVRTSSTSMPSPASGTCVTDNNSMVDVMEASCDLGQHRKKVVDHKAKPSKKFYKRSVIWPECGVSSLSSEDACPSRSARYSFKREPSRSVRNRPPVVDLPRQNCRLLYHLSSSEENLRHEPKTESTLKPKQKDAAKKKTEFSNFLMGLRYAIPYLPQRLQATLAQSDSSPETAGPNSSFSWENSSTSGTDVSSPEHDHDTTRKNNGEVDKPDFSISCMDDILTELEEISADLGNVCDCASVTDKLSSSSETGTADFSDESSSSSDSGEADDEFECECASCQLLREQRVDHRVMAPADSEPVPAADSESQGAADLWFPHTDEEEGVFQINVAELSPLESLTSERSGMLDLMFENVIIQMLAVHPDLLNDQAPPPASDELIDSLPSVVLTQEHIDQSPSCPVCLCPCAIDEVLTRLPCQHLFHPLCIRAWLIKSGTCPVCRHVLRK
ncbi:hypothetical protein ScPMuIL_003144 [Solemya velum]